MTENITLVKDKISEASSQMMAYLGSINLSDAAGPVSEAHALALFVMSIASVILCCASTSSCVRAARDSNIAINALSIRKRYHRNMQLYMLLREKDLADKMAEKAASRLENSAEEKQGHSLTESEQDSSFLTSSGDGSMSYD